MTWNIHGKAAKLIAHRQIYRNAVFLIVELAWQLRLALGDETNQTHIADIDRDNLAKLLVLIP